MMGRLKHYQGQFCSWRSSNTSPQPPSMSLLHDLLDKVSSATVGSVEFDKDIIAAFPTASNGITKSIDAIVRLIETELPGWWWVCGFCTLSNDASIEVPRARTGPIFEPGQNRCDCLLTLRWGTYSTKVSTMIAGAVRYHSPCSRCSFRPNLHWLNWKHRVLRD